MDTEPTNTSPKALGKFVDGVEEKARGEGEHHVAILWEGDDPRPPQRENEFTSQEALDEWIETLPPQDSVVVVHYPDEAPDPDNK